MASHTGASTPSAPGLIIPLYIYPGSAWSEIIAEKQANPSVPITVIANPGNGPGAQWSSTYDSAIVQMREAGINVIGYVPTEYGSVGLSTAESQIAAWEQMYWVNGIFLDQMADVGGYQSYYSNLTAYAHSLGLSLVVGNPGTPVPSSLYYGTVDVLLIYENSGVPTMTTLANDTQGGTKGEFAIVSYGVPSLTTTEVDLEAGYAADIYITSGVAPGPYQSLPSYFSSLVSDLASYQSTTTPLTVQSEETAGTAVSGVWTTISSGGVAAYEGYTPFTFMGTTGAQYTVTVSNHDSQNFVEWQGGGTSASQTVTLSSALTLTAEFANAYTMNVSSQTSSGTSLTGMWTEFWAGGSMVASGFSPLSYTGTPGSDYTVCVDNYDTYTFSHWNDGSTSACQVVTLSQNLQMTATYNT